MNRVCCYITSGNHKYCRMVATSIKMLRKHNKSIKVKVFLVDCERNKLLDGLPIEIINKKSTSNSRKYNYFCFNREHLKDCNEESVLHIDGDTFIFDDIEKIFDRYQMYDFAAAEDKYIINTSDWKEEDLSRCYRKLETNKVPVFNGGFTLWNNRKIKGWCENLVDISVKLQTRELDLPWLFNNDRNCYHQETFSICLHVAKEKLSYKLMDRKDIVNLFNEKNIRDWYDKDFIVYHCFTQNWKMFADQVVLPKKLNREKRIILR